MDFEALKQAMRKKHKEKDHVAGFGERLEEMSWSACATCARKSKGLYCEAFPGGIPVAILEGVHRHDTPYEGDGGLLHLAISTTPFMT